MKTTIKENRVTGKKKVEEFKAVKATPQNPIRLDPQDIVPPTKELANIRYVHIWKKADLKFMKYGMVTVPLAEQWVDGSIMDTGQYLDILNQYSMKGKTEWRPVGRLMSREYALIPNKLLIEKVTDAGFEISEERYTRGGNRMYLEVRSKKVTENVKVGDTVQAGVMIRNSVDGSMSVGVDGFTYRLSCLNGAVMRGDEAFKTSFIHLGKDVLENVKAAIDKVMMYVKDKMQIYKLANEVKVTNPLAHQFLDMHTVPERYLPNWIDANYQTDDKTRERILNSVKVKDYNKTFWDLFNDLTETYWHKMTKEKKMSVENTFSKEINLHDALEIVVTQPNPNYGLLRRAA